MKDFLIGSRVKYHLSLGEYEFSPVMEASIALSLAYRNLHIETRQEFPFHLSFPDKNLASFWLSISLLTNFFLEDYIDQLGITEIASFEKGDKVEIFDVVAEIESISHDKLTLRFSDQGGIPINKKLRQQINRTKKNLINKKDLFIKRYREHKKDRNPISKILEPNDSVIINENYLTSKVLLVTGRGNAKQLRALLSTIKIYDEPLNKIFSQDKNLIIKKDLEAYKNIFDTLFSDRENLFKELLLAFLQKEEVLEKILKDNLIRLLKANLFLTAEFKNEFDEMIELFYGEELNQLKKISTLYPGVKETLPENLKAVIINEIEQIDLYKGIITGFLKAGIPVYVISDRYIQVPGDLVFLNDFFNKYPKTYRINWNKQKINALQETINVSVKYLDCDLWKNCLRYAEQHININVCDGTDLDKLLYQSQKVIRELNEFESLQKAYYKFLFPAMYLFKNSGNKINTISELSEHFDFELQKTKHFIDKGAVVLLQRITDFLKSDVSNTKTFEITSDVFSNLLPVGIDKKAFIPADCTTINVADSDTIKMFFSGYPFNEFSGKYLIDAVCLCHVPEITLLCWPAESEFTFNYLMRRILAGYFTDNLHPLWEIPDVLLLKEKKDFINEIHSFLSCNAHDRKLADEETKEHENDLVAIANFKYKGYDHSFSGTQTFRVKCDILNFSDGSFLFLPKNSKVLTQVENDDGSLRFKNCLFSELEIGAKVFKYKKDRSDFRDLSRNNTVIRKSFHELELWKDTLSLLFIKSNSNLDQLEKFLLQTKMDRSLAGNPSKGNIQRWLYDDELIAPDMENIKIILSAAGLEEIDKIVENIYTAFREVCSYTISLSSKIKKNITDNLRKTRNDEFETDFKLNIESVEINVENRIVTGLERSDIEVEYYNTRKILS